MHLVRGQGGQAMEQLMTYAQAAEYLQLPRGTLYAMVSRGLIPHLRVSRRLVRFSKESLERWLAERARPVVTQTSAEGGSR
jgi:excisionase family DNA binding protein